MKATLDHNVVIDFANCSPRVEQLRAQIATGDCEAFVVEVGASEFRQRSV